jgi:AAA domain
MFGMSLHCHTQRTLLVSLTATAAVNHIMLPQDLLMQQLDGCLGVVAVSNMHSKGGGLRVAFHRRNLARLQRVAESSAVKKAAAATAAATAAAGASAAGATAVAGAAAAAAAAAAPAAAASSSSSGRGSGRGSCRGSGRSSGSSVRGGRAVTGTGWGSASKTFGTGRGQQQGPAYGATSVKLKARTAAAIAAGGASDTTVFVHNLGSTQSVLREWEALNALDKLPLMQEILMTPEHKVTITSANGSSSNGSSSNGSSSSSSGDTKAAAAQIRATRAAPSAATVALSKLLQPLDEHSKGVGAGQLGQAFVSWMQGRFNPSQRHAIKAAASDEGFTLVKGPPGTGKTTTLTALLNALHVREYNRFYTAMLGLARADDGVDTEAAWTKLRRTKPHILVTAPSNAGVDNVLQRILANGFLDGGGGRYNPPVIRVGRGAGSATKSVVLDDQVLCTTVLLYYYITVLLQATVLLYYCKLLYACFNTSYCSLLLHRVQFVH